MNKLLEFVRTHFQTEKDAATTPNSPQANSGHGHTSPTSPRLQRAELHLTFEEKQEIVEAFDVLLDENAKEADKEEYFGSFKVVRNVKPEELCLAHEIFVYREPEVWETNLISLEKGEWGPGMKQENFKRWGTRRRPRLPSCFLKPDQTNLKERRNSIKNIRLFQQHMAEHQKEMNSQQQTKSPHLNRPTTPVHGLRSNEKEGDL